MQAGNRFEQRSDRNTEKSILLSVTQSGGALRNIEGNAICRSGHLVGQIVSFVLGELFGDVEPSGTFLRRLGDLVLTHRDLGTWWGDHEPEELELVGMHGGLHPDEMLTGVAAVRLSDLF